MNLDYVDPEYEARCVYFSNYCLNRKFNIAHNDRMISSEIDCFGGKGIPGACHQCGDFYAVVKVIELLKFHVFKTF